MLKRKYTHIKGLMPEIKAMLEEGKSHREIEEHFGLEGERPIHNLLKRERRKERKSEVLRLPKRKGRPRKSPLSPARRIKELEREVELLKSFLHAAGRM